MVFVPWCLLGHGCRGQKWCKRGDGPHFVAASSVQGALAGTQKKNVLISMQMMNTLPCTCTNKSGGTGSLKATSSKPVALSSGLLCSKNDSMNL